MFSPFKKSLSARIYIATTAAIVLLSIAMYLLSVPFIQSTVESVEERSARTVLDDVYEMVKQIDRELANTGRNTLQERKNGLINIIAAAESHASWLDNQVREGKLTRDTAKRMLLADVRHMQYGNNDYIFAADYRSVLVSHPDPKLNGADFSEVHDVRGNLVIPPMVAGARASGAGFYSYWWRRLGEENPVEKLTYYQHLPAFGVVICTGLYLDDIEIELGKMRARAVRELRERLNPIRFAKTGYVYVFDGSDKMIIHPNANIEGKNVAGVLEPATKRPLFPLLRAIANKGESLRYKWDSPEDPNHFVYDKISWVRYFAGFDWYIGSSVYQDELAESARTLRNRVVAVFGLFLLVAMALVYLFVQKLVGPLRQLSGAAARVQAGDLGARCAVRGEDEMAVVATAFNGMIERVQDNIQNLDAKVSERTAELEEANQRLQTLDQLKSDFLSSVSHEIRTPMNAIIGMSHLALQTDLDKKQRNYVEKVHRSGENLLGIINDILDFSKIEAGKMSMERIDFRLEDVMDNLANLIEMRAKEKGLELLFDAAPDVPTALLGDPLRLGQVLINLGNNAAKFTEKGEIVVGVEKFAEDADGVELHFWVKDTGIGMTPEQCGRMFRSFSQADASTTRKYGGTGLGLAISKNLVELMGGRIWVESEAGRGSTFHFHARFGLPAEPMPRRLLRADELRGLRVLVVDDNSSAQEILSAMAKTFGLQVDVAWDGKQALAAVATAVQANRPYDLVLMDWMMPVMDGVETVRRLQEAAAAPAPEVIMVTAYGRDEAVDAALQRGVALKSVLTKPVTPSTLLEAIGEALGKDLVATRRTDEKADKFGELMAKLAGARVLLVEDNELNQELALELLGQAGMEVVVANNGQEALDILGRDGCYDGVLMDCQMPVMDGFTATREIRRNPVLQHLPIIAMTANATAEDKEKVSKAGMLDHIAKPLNVGEMFATIGKWIKPAHPVERSHEAQAPTALSSVPLDLPGVDTAAGLATTMNNMKLYRNLLIKFRDSQGGFAKTFEAARRDDDPTAAARTAHTLRGAAGNIGAKGTQQAAEDLERACHGSAPQDEIDHLLAVTLEKLKTVIGSLATLPADKGAQPVAALNNRQLKLLVEQLGPLVDDDDMEAGEVAAKLAELVEGTPLAKPVGDVVQAVANFDTDAAQEALKRVADEIGKG